MMDIKALTTKLQLFQNLTLTRPQWKVILEGCNFPKSEHLWTALRESILIKLDNYPMYTLTTITRETVEKVISRYKEINCTYASAYYNKKRQEKAAKERSQSFKAFTLYMVGGVLTTEKPSFDQKYKGLQSSTIGLYYNKYN